MKPHLPLTLFREPSAASTNVYSWSMFVTKLEARLRFSHKPYSLSTGTPLKAPKGKIPFVRIGDGSDENSEMLGDSAIIIRRLIELGEIEDFNGEIDSDAGEAAERRARDLGIRALVEDRFYFYSVSTSCSPLEWLEANVKRCTSAG